MPQLGKCIFFHQFLWLVILLGVLYFLLVKGIFPSILGSLKFRKTLLTRKSRTVTPLFSALPSLLGAGSGVSYLPYPSSVALMAFSFPLLAVTTFNFSPPVYSRTRIWNFILRFSLQEEGAESIMIRFEGWPSEGKLSCSFRDSLVEYECDIRAPLAVSFYRISDRLLDQVRPLH